MLFAKQYNASQRNDRQTFQKSAEAPLADSLRLACSPLIWQSVSLRHCVHAHGMHEIVKLLWQLQHRRMVLFCWILRGASGRLLLLAVLHSVTVLLVLIVMVRMHYHTARSVTDASATCNLTNPTNPTMPMSFRTLVTLTAMCNNSINTN